MQSIKFEFADPDHCVITLTTTAGVATSYRFEHYEAGAPISALRPVESDGRALIAALGTSIYMDTERVLAAVWELALAIRDAQSNVAPDGSPSVAPASAGAPSSAPRVNADIGPAPESDDGDDKKGQ